MIRQGGYIYMGKPYVYVLSPSQYNRRCMTCFVYSDDLKRCSSCKVVRYCSVKCQKDGWCFHKTECKAFKNCAPKIPTESVVLMHRLLCREQLGEHESIREEILNTSRCFHDLMTHSEEIQQDVTRVSDFYEIVSSLDKFNPEMTRLTSNEEAKRRLLDTFGRVCTNSFTVLDEGLIPIGAAVYLGASLLDHSCAPNASVVFDGNRLIIRALRDIDTAKEPVLINYVSRLATREQRQEQLLKQYYFTCQCAECARDLWDSMEPWLLSSVCPRPGCDGCIVNTNGSLKRCQACGQEVSNSDYRGQKKKASNHIKDTLDKVKILHKNKDYEKLLALCSEVLQETVSILHSYHIYRIQIQNYAAEACITLQRFDKALEFYTTMEPAYRKFLTENDPQFGVFLVTLSKLLIYENKHPVLALKYLSQAERSLTISHGQDHPLLKSTVPDLMQQARLMIQADSQHETT